MWSMACSALYRMPKRANCVYGMNVASIRRGGRDVDAMAEWNKRLIKVYVC